MLSFWSLTHTSCYAAGLDFHPQMWCCISGSSVTLTEEWSNGAEEQVCSWLSAQWTCWFLRKCSETWVRFMMHQNHTLEIDKAESKTDIVRVLMSQWTWESRNSPWKWGTERNTRWRVVDRQSNHDSTRPAMGRKPVIHLCSSRVVKHGDAVSNRWYLDGVPSFESEILTRLSSMSCILRIWVIRIWR